MPEIPGAAAAKHLLHKCVALTGWGRWTFDFLSTVFQELEAEVSHVLSSRVAVHGRSCSTFRENGDHGHLVAEDAERMCMNVVVDWALRTGKRHADALANGETKDFTPEHEVRIHQPAHPWKLLPEALLMGRAAEMEPRSSERGTHRKKGMSISGRENQKKGWLRQPRGD